jgi:hypothetical protein
MQRKELRARKLKQMAIQAVYGGSFCEVEVTSSTKFHWPRLRVSYRCR